MSAKPMNTAEMLGAARSLHQAGRLGEAEDLYRRILAVDKRNAEAAHLLGVVALQVGQFDVAADLIGQAIAVSGKVAQYHTNLAAALKELGQLPRAVQALESALALNPTSPEILTALGNTLAAQRRYGEAITHYERAIALRPQFAEAHNNLGNALKDQGDRDAALKRYLQAVALKPDYVEAIFNLGNLLKDGGSFGDAKVHYERALTLKPDFAPAHNNLGSVLKDLDQADEAIACYRRAVALAPDFIDAYRNLGAVLHDEGRLDEAQACFEKVLALAPDDADAHMGLGNVLVLRDQHTEAQRFFRRAHQLRPLTKRAGLKAPPDFSILLLHGPDAGNTPSDFLVGRADYDSYFLTLMDGVDYDIAALRAKADVVVNLVSDVDRGRAALPIAARLVERLGRPVINHPRKIAATGREMIAARLAGLEGCRVPKTLRLLATPLAAADNEIALAGLRFPLVMRPAGAHGGDEFEKLDGPAAVAAFAARHPDADFYVSEYVPYASPDGFFRKYRLIFVGGRILPYHLAIADHWKVHYFRTDMAHQAWMRDEEDAFMKEPGRVFGGRSWRTLEAIAAAMDLDYCGIDCGIDADGNIIVFEANATMLVHDETAVFAYKSVYIARIKHAFDGLLAQSSRTSERG